MIGLSMWIVLVDVVVGHPIMLDGWCGPLSIAGVRRVGYRLAPATKVETMLVAWRSSDPRPRS